MGAFFVYILKSAVCLSAFYLFYRLLLSRETFHRFNRVAILGILVISLLIPWCEVSMERHTEVQQTVLSLEQLLLLADFAEKASVEPAQGTKTVWVQVVLMIYLIGIVFFICRNLYVYLKLYKLLRAGRREPLDGGVTLVVHTRGETAPFSWMKYIVISQQDLEENGREILTHEIAHIRNRHSIDLLVSDICILFQWFNPGSWLLKQELQNIHEYEADETVIKNGIDAKQYQLLLIKKAVGTRLYSMANSFNHNNLKKRITMMLKKKSNPWARLKYAYVLPVAAIAVTAFARPEISGELKEISALKADNLVSVIVSGENNDQEGYVAVQEVADRSDYGQAEEVTATLVPMKNDKEVAQRVVSLPDQEKPPLVLIEGKEAPLSVLSALDSKRIESITVLKDKSALDLYGEKGANGVILVELKKGEEGVLADKTLSGIVSQVNTTSAIPAGVLIIVDGKRVEGASSIAPEQISSMNVRKAPTGEELKELVEKYGEEAKAGVVEITTKKTEDKIRIVVRGVKEEAKDAEKMKVNGLVLDSNGKPVIGASVLIVGTTTGTITNMEGKFILNAENGDFLSVIYPNMEKKVIKAESELTIHMKDE